MGVLSSFFSSFFKRNKFSEELGFDDLAGSVKEKIFFAENLIDEQKKRIEVSKQNVLDSLRILDNPKMADEKDEKIVQKVVSNKNAYLMHCKTFIEWIDVSDIGNVSDFCASAEFKFKDFLSRVAKNFQVAQYLIGQELLNTAEKLRFFMSDVQKLGALGADFEKLRVLSSRISLLLEKISFKESADKRIVAEKGILKNLENSKRSAENDFKKLKDSDEFKDFESKVLEKEKKETELQKIGFQISNFFSPLNKALKKYAKISLDPEIVELYSEKPVNALLEDKDLEVLDVLKKLEANLEKLDIKDDKLQKTMVAIERIDNEKLVNLQTNYKFISSEIDFLNDEVSNFGIREKLELKKNEIGSFDAKIDSVKKKIVSIESEKSFNPDDEKKAVENELSLLNVKK